MKTKKPPMPSTAEWLKQHKSKPVVWDEHMKILPGTTLIQAKSYNAWTMSHMEMLGLAHLKPLYIKDDEQIKKHGLKVGDLTVCLSRMPVWEYSQRVIMGWPVGGKFWTKCGLSMPSRMRSMITFDAPTLIPVLWDTKEQKVWMSLTPMEVVTQRQGIARARGHVLMAGLGMGWLADRVLAKPGVTRVTIVDIRPDVVEVFGRPLQDKYGKDKCKLVTDDVWNYLNIKSQDQTLIPKLDQYTSHLFDIWASYSGASISAGFASVKKCAPKAWAWGSFANN